jgi:hypothetical protein
MKILFRQFFFTPLQPYYDLQTVKHVILQYPTLVSPNILLAIFEYFLETIDYIINYPTRQEIYYNMLGKTLSNKKKVLLLQELFEQLHYHQQRQTQNEDLYYSDINLFHQFIYVQHILQNNIYFNLNYKKTFLFIMNLETITSVLQDNPYWKEELTATTKILSKPKYQIQINNVFSKEEEEKNENVHDFILLSF